MRRLVLLLALFLLAAVSAAQPPRPPAGAIASAHPLATAVGQEILAQGGNAFDAAVAIAATLAVVEPYSSGLGGGGFWLLHRAADGRDLMIDGRERAPLAASRDMYLGRNGRPVPNLSLDGPLAAAIPGTPAALAHVAEKYGRLPLRQSLAPAIRLARAGFALTALDVRRIAQRREALLAHPAAARVFLDNGAVPREGYILRQPDLALTLERMAEEGPAAFYRGPIAGKLVRGVRDARGIWSAEDLADYRVIEREPVRGSYRGMRVTSAALPSSGGIVLLEALNVLEGFDLAAMNRVRYVQTVVEAMRLAYRDRAEYLGDPDFVKVDVARLLSRAHAQRLRREMRLSRVPAPADLAPAGEGRNTTHFSVIDRDGNLAAVTLTLNTLFGSGFMPPGTGVVLNNEMDDFVAKPGVPNTYGLVGGEANAIAPGKRPLSSMTPTFLETPDKVVVLGTPGGSRIISMVLLVALEVAQGRGSAVDWAALPRFHHQYLPDRIEYEPGALSDADARTFERLGYALRRVEGGYGNMQLVVRGRRTNRLEAASDPRGEGAASVK